MTPQRSNAMSELWYTMRRSMKTVPDMFRRLCMLAGFAAAFAGDWFLAIKGSPPKSAGFFYGVICFSTAQVCWTIGQLREARPSGYLSFALGIPLAVFSAVRLLPVLHCTTGLAVCAYSILSAIALDAAYATRRMFYVGGIGLLLVSDVLIGGGLLHAPGCSSLVGPLYIAAELCLLTSFFMPREPRFDPTLRNPWPPAIMYGAGAFLLFLLAAFCYPGGGYNPLMQMLSSLGRTETKMVRYPWCHYMFICAMALSAMAVGAVWAHLARRGLRGWRGVLARIGGPMNVAGLLLIALVPENVNMYVHDIGCHLAAAGGGCVLVALDKRGVDRRWTHLLLAIISFFGLCLVAHSVKLVPFAPWVTATQKLLIVSFATWVGYIGWREKSSGLRIWQISVLSIFIALGAFAAFLQCRGGNILKRTGEAAVVAHRPAVKPLSPDEQAALRWLDHVTGPLSDAEEKEWWDIGRQQFGLFAKRYNIAFCGYAAAMLGQSCDATQRKTVGRILGNCISRYLKRDIWAYSMSRNYWGRKPWAPDPCFRENVMYTGHLLQLLALYELYTGDTRYWKDGFDFIWDEKRKVHYTVKKLIDVTVHQMRKGPNGGVCCEPGLMFFPCNNHPHVALAIFARLGHGDWTKDARRWERWALGHYVNPLFGGGMLNLVYHPQSGLFYPRGHGSLDGWSLLWYEPWAENRGTAVGLWRQAAKRIDWNYLDRAPDTLAGGETCCNPIDVPPVASAVFLAAAARACDDTATAARLEKLVEPRLSRKDGMLYVDVGREWRIGVTANYFIALAEKNGRRFRRILFP